MRPLPIEIVGGGLAGLSLGIALRRAGIPVTLHEAGNYPRHRVCGEFIAGLAPSTVQRLGLGAVLARALPHREVAWFIRSAHSHVQTLPQVALGISRFSLDAQLAEEFRNLGGDLHLGSRRPEQGDRPGLIWAAGRRRSREPRWLGLKVHVRGLALVRDLEMHLGDRAYAGLTRVEAGAVNVCGLFRQRELPDHDGELLPAYLRASGLETLAGRLAAATPVPGSRCAVAALQFDAGGSRAAGLRLGDASATIPPFTGNGMAMALQSAELALNPVLAYARGEIGWSEACRTVVAAGRNRFRLRLISARALHSFLLAPRRQHWLAHLSRWRLLPMSGLYAALH